TGSSYFRWESTAGDPDTRTQNLSAGSEAIASSWFAVADGSRVAAVECDCFPSLGLGTRTITSFRPRFGQTGPLDGTYFDCMHCSRRPVSGLDRAGRERGLVTATDFAQPGGNRGDQLTLAVENTGDVSWTFDPRNVVVWGVGNAWPVATQWETGNAD